jgi:hypothetical protein
MTEKGIYEERRRHGDDNNECRREKEHAPVSYSIKNHSILMQQSEQTSKNTVD